MMSRPYLVALAAVAVLAPTAPVCAAAGADGGVRVVGASSQVVDADPVTVDTDGDGFAETSAFRLDPDPWRTPVRTVAAHAALDPRLGRVALLAGTRAQRLSVGTQLGVSGMTPDTVERIVGQAAQLAIWHVTSALEPAPVSAAPADIALHRVYDAFTAVSGGAPQDTNLVLAQGADGRPATLLPTERRAAPTAVPAPPAQEAPQQQSPPAANPAPVASSDDQATRRPDPQTPAPSGPAPSAPASSSSASSAPASSSASSTPEPAAHQATSPTSGATVTSPAVSPPSARRLAEVPVVALGAPSSFFAAGVPAGTTCLALRRTDISRTDAQYSPSLDRDGDGMACESNGQDGPVDLGTPTLAAAPANPASAAPASAGQAPVGVGSAVTGGVVRGGVPISTSASTSGSSSMAGVDTTSTCGELKARGLGGNFRPGNPLYTLKRDADSDQIACEDSSATGSTSSTSAVGGLAYTGLPAHALGLAGGAALTLGVALVAVGRQARRSRHRTRR